MKVPQKFLCNSQEYASGYRRKPEIQIILHENKSFKFWVLIEQLLGEPHRKNCHFYLGIAQMAIAPPPHPPHSNGGTLFSDQFEQLCQITVLMVISAPKHPGKP